MRRSPRQRVEALPLVRGQGGQRERRPVEPLRKLLEGVYELRQQALRGSVAHHRRIDEREQAERVARHEDEAVDSAVLALAFVSIRLGDPVADRLR